MTVLHTIDNVSLTDLARQHGTPYYVYSRAMLEQRINDLKQHFDLIRYAQKANPHLAVLGLMRKHGVVVDAVSAGEIRRALRAGYEPQDVVYTADVFDLPTLGLIKNYPIPVNCGSPDMIRQFAEARPGGDVTLRVNPGFGHGHSHKCDTGGPSSKHGIWHEDLAECVQLAQAQGLRVTGLHMHIGSGTNFEHLSKVGGAMAALIDVAGSHVEVISAGGGLPVPYHEEDDYIDLAHYKEVWETHRQAIQDKLGHPVRLEVEPGRYLTADAGWLVARIWAIKRTPEYLFYLLDSGFNHLARPVLYGAYHPISICPHDKREIAERTHAVVAGPLCESGDVFTQEEGEFVVSREMPQAEVGDLLVLHKAGAYGKAMASNYNSHPYPPELWLEDGEATVITPRQKLDDMIGEEIIPTNLR